ncbi:MAG: hypothetical protein IPL32_09655 [Chloracidobacterium sp.]|nr:hypothetical protein [Chloracidobacterium sp.]
MILVILAIWFGYKKARDSGRNPWLWAAISGGIFIGTQLLVGLGFGVLIVIGQELWGWDDRAFDNYSLLANIPAIILSIVALWLVFRFLDRIPEDPPQSQPPPPPTFDGQE